jgi:FixJ family two-component response regulator
MLQASIVYVVDDDPVSLEAVAALVSEMGISCRTFPSAEAFLEAYDGHRPGCLVTDVRMLGMSGVELQERLVADGVTLSVVVLTAYADTPTTVRAIKGGAVTLLEKPCRDQELWDAIRTACMQDAERSQKEKRTLSARQRVESLTPAETRVLERILHGDSNKMMARRLNVSVRTIEVRRQNIFKKIEVDSVAELVRVYFEAFPERAT